MQNNGTPLLNSTDNDIKVELQFVKQSESLPNYNYNTINSNALNNNPKLLQHSYSYSPPPQGMSSTFIEQHLSSNEITLDENDDNEDNKDDTFHILQLSPEDFRDLSINFYPGFAERNAFLGHFKSTRKRRKKKKYNDQTPLYQNEHKSNNIKIDRKIEDTFENTLRSLSSIPVGSRLRYINFTDCEDMLYSNIMGLLATELVQCQNNIILKFEDVRSIQQKVKNSSGAVMAWHVKQQTLGVNFSKNINKSTGCKYKCFTICFDCSHITHSCVRDIVDSWYITLLVFIVILYDLSIVFYSGSHRLFWDTSSYQQSESEQDLVIYLTLLALTLYLIEINFRIYGYGKHFIGTPIHLLNDTATTELHTKQDVIQNQQNGQNDQEKRKKNNLNLSNFEKNTGRINFEINQEYHQQYRTCHCCDFCKYIRGYLTRGWIEFIDSFIIIISFILTILDIIYLNNDHIPFIELPFLYECLRCIRVIFRIICKAKYTPKCIRLIVRVNRQTYFDENFDLDLCYIVYPRYLVMSWPSSGFESLYRNPLNDVAKFLNRYHSNNYLIFDLCLERSYDDMLFNGRVMRSRAMTDHSVCSLSDMFEFAQLVHLWLRHNPIHCAVIHCKGGKGRTGLMVCACLMYDYRDTTVDEALEYFATMRTNITKGGKLQGVETPSQLRYCKYFYQLLHITDVLKIKQQNQSSSYSLDRGKVHKQQQQQQQQSNNKRQSQSYSQNTINFYNMVIAASPQNINNTAIQMVVDNDDDYDDNDNNNDSSEETKDDELQAPIPTLPQKQDSRIIDEETREKIAKHLDSDDLNISGLKQSKHGRESVISDQRQSIGNTPEPAEYAQLRMDYSLKSKTSNVGSDVAISTLKVDQDRLYARGQWETSNPSLQSMLLLHQRYSSNIKTATDTLIKNKKNSLNPTKPYTDIDKSSMDYSDKNKNKNKNKKTKKKHRRQKSASEAWLERQRDSTVIAQSLAQSKPLKSLPTIDSLPNTPNTQNTQNNNYSNDNIHNIIKPISTKSTKSRKSNNNQIHIADESGTSLYDMMQYDEYNVNESKEEEEESYDNNNNEESYSLVQQINNTRISITSPTNNIINNDMSIYMKRDNVEHFVSVSNESYLSELFLKQPVVMKLKYVSIGPFTSNEWNNKSIYWKINICMKRDFDYFDDMKIYQFTYYQIEENNFHRMKFSAFDNLCGGRTSLALNGNICFKIFRCKKEGVIHDKKIKDEFGDNTEKMIGTIWIHSHFIPANYKQKIDKMTFRKEEIDNMYKDKKNKTSIPQSFSVEIGYRCSRITINHQSQININKNKKKIAHV